MSPVSSYHRLRFLAVVVLFMPLPSNAQAPANADRLIDDMARCRAEKDERVRVACYDSAIDPIIKAHRDGDITILTRQDVTEQRRAVFGLTVDDKRLFGNRANRLPPIDSLDSTVARVASTGQGYFIVTLVDDTAWKTTDLARTDPRASNSVHIKKAAFGSYLASFAGARSIRVQRVR